MKRPRKNSGSAIAEFGPCLWVLIILMFFPLAGLLAISMQFSSVWYLNHLVAQSLSNSNFPSWTDSIQQTRTKFDKTGVPMFAKMVDVEQDYTCVPADSTQGSPAFVIATTKVDCRPFFMVPLPIKIAGLNGNVQLCVTSTRMWETFNPNDANQSTRQTASVAYTE